MMDNLGSRAGLARLSVSTLARGVIAGALVISMFVGVAPGASADDDDDNDNSRGGGRRGNGNVYALTDGNELLSFDVQTPGRIRSRRQISGIAGDLIGIDFRPADGLLYAANSQGQIYTIDTDSAAATPRSQMNVVPAGSRFGFDFNPNADRLRIVSDQEQNLRVNVDDGTTTTDGPLAYAAGDRNAGGNPSAVGAAYTNPDTDPNTPTTLFDVDSGLDVLTRQDPPNDGTLNTVGALTLDVADLVGFDIGMLGRSGESGSNNDNSNNDNSDDDDSDNDNSDDSWLGGGSPYSGEQALAAFQAQGGMARLYSIDLTSGAAQNRGQIGDGETIDGLAIDPRASR